MILKYKLNNGSWRFISLTDFVVGKVDISGIYNKYLNKDTGKFNPNMEDGSLYKLRNIFDEAAFYGLDFNDTYEICYGDKIVNEHMNYVVVSYNNDKNLVLYNETYLMADDGRTIERLI